MNKTDFIDRFASKFDRSKADSAAFVDQFFEIVTETLVNGEEVVFPGFGKWAVSHRNARTGRNPQTGQPIQIAAADVPVFKAGKSLKDAVKNK